MELKPGDCRPMKRLVNFAGFPGRNGYFCCHAYEPGVGIPEAISPVRKFVVEVANARSFGETSILAGRLP